MRRIMILGSAIEKLINSPASKRHDERISQIALHFSKMSEADRKVVINIAKPYLEKDREREKKVEEDLIDEYDLMEEQGKENIKVGKEISKWFPFMRNCVTKRNFGDYGVAFLEYCLKRKEIQ